MSQTANASKGKQTEKHGFFGRIALFIRQVIDELHKVVWPTSNELWTYFAVVVVFVLAIMLFVGVLDFGFERLIDLVFG